VDGDFGLSTFVEARLDTCGDCLWDKCAFYRISAGLGRGGEGGKDPRKQVGVGEQDRIYSFVSIPVAFRRGSHGYNGPGS